jgi:dethiobiotin synthetase
MTVLVVSGTGTSIGKTTVTAALAALNPSCAVVKPVQTGIGPAPDLIGVDATLTPTGGVDATLTPNVSAPAPAPAPAPADESDISAVTRLSGVTDTHELVRYPDPLSPEAAARVSGLKPPDLSAMAAYIRSLPNDLVLVEGAGGLLVRYDPSGSTLADLAAMLDATVLLVVAAGLGTLNHTALTLEALHSRGLTCSGIVIGAWPATPDIADRENLTDLRNLADGPLAGLLPAGAGALTREEFLQRASAWISPRFGGTFRG